MPPEEQPTKEINDKFDFTKIIIKNFYYVKGSMKRMKGWAADSKKVFTNHNVSIIYKKLNFQLQKHEQVN